MCPPQHKGQLDKADLAQKQDNGQAREGDEVYYIVGIFQPPHGPHRTFSMALYDGVSFCLWGKGKSIFRESAAGGMGIPIYFPLIKEALNTVTSDVAWASFRAGQRQV